jgi:protease-4
VWLGFASTAVAAPPLTTDRAPTDGVDRVYHDYSADGDASSIELNPALLSAIRGFDLTLLGYSTTDPFVRGSGFGAFGAANLGFGLGMGLGLQLVQPGLDDGVFDFDEAANPAMSKISWAFSGGLGKFGAMGVGVHGIRAGGAWLQRPDVDIGLMTRITNFASLGAMARLGPADLRSETLPSELSVIGELSLRPLGTHNLELAGGFKQRVLEAEPGMGSDNLGLDGLLGRGRVQVRYQGIALRGEVEQVAATMLDEQSFTPLRQEKALRGSVSLELSWDALSAGAGVHTGVSDGIDGVGYHARFHTWRRGRVFWPRVVAADRLDLRDMDDQRSLVPMLERIERAREAGKRAVLVVDARQVGGGWATLHELREALKRVRNAGGHVFAYVENADLKDYYVASVAERVYIHPAGGLETYGISQTALYFKEALGKIGVKAEVVKVREYKSAGERFDRDEPSEHDAKQRKELQRDVYVRVVWDIAQARGLSTSAVVDMFEVDSLG